jgi:hypothetical protein
MKIVLSMNLYLFGIRHLKFNCILIYVLFYLILLNPNFCWAQTISGDEKLSGKWNINLHHNAVGNAQFLIDFETNQDEFEAHSRKNADRDILGFWTSLLSRTFTKNFKKGSLLRIEGGRFQFSNDTIYLKGKLISTIGNLNIDGFVVGDELQSTLKYDNGNIAGNISGNRIIPDLPLSNYKNLFHDIKVLTQKHIYNKDVLKTKEWEVFTEKMNSSASNFQDDLDMIFAFYYHSRNLPFSHFSLTKTLKPTKKSNPTKPKKGYLTLKQKNSDTAYLKILSFNGTSTEVDSIFKIINEREYGHLIVDLRNNSGGNVEAGITFATNVIDKVSYGGVFLTQKWFNNHSGLPQIEDYNKFAFFSEANNDLILEGIHKTKGLCLKVIPKEKTYKGQLYILVNKNTASTCEPIVYELKKQERALIIGETSAGAMLSSETFDLDSDYKITIPTADYYASDGYKIDQNGVKPNIKTSSEDALLKAFEKIANIEE